LPGSPMRRPCIESSANWYNRVRRSFAVIAETVGRGAHRYGPSSGQAGFTFAGQVPGFCGAAAFVWAPETFEMIRNGRSLARFRIVGFVAQLPRGERRLRG